MWPRNGVRPLRPPTVTRTLVSCILTTLSYLTDVHALLCCHEAQHREHHEACKEAGSTVDYSQYKCISAEKCEEKNGEWEGEQWLTLWAKRERAISICCNMSFVWAVQDSDWQQKRWGMKGKQQLLWELLLFRSWQVQDRKDNDNSVFAQYRPQFNCTKYNSIYSLISLIKICSWTSCSYFQCVCNGLIGLGGMVEQCRMYIIKTSKI